MDMALIGSSISPAMLRADDENLWYFCGTYLFQPLV